jgi:hypothetical protein
MNTGHFRKAPLLIALVTFVIGCGGGRSLLLDQRRTEAPALEKQCAALGIDNEKTGQAKELSSMGTKLVAEGNSSEALLLFDHAVAIYRLELVKHQFAAATARKAELEAEIEGARNRVQTYEQVLNQLQSES